MSRTATNSHLVWVPRLALWALLPLTTPLQKRLSSPLTIMKIWLRMSKVAQPWSSWTVRTLTEASGLYRPRIAPIAKLRCFAFYGRTRMMLSAQIRKQSGSVVNNKLWSTLLTKLTTRPSSNFANSVDRRKETRSCRLARAWLPLGTALTSRVELSHKLSEKTHLSKPLTSSSMSSRKNTSSSKAISGNHISVHLKESRDAIYGKSWFKLKKVLISIRIRTKCSYSIVSSSW